MHVKQWITKLRKSVRSRSKTSIFRSPGFAQVAAVSLIVMLAVAAIVVIAHQATPAASAAPAVKPVAVSSSSATVPAKRTAGGKAKNASAATSAQASEVVTITGCLEEKNDAFRLKDTSGVDAPKSRSWKTGFITKHSSSVTVVDASNRMKLASHVGERVSLTGTLADREMQARTLQRVAESCD